MRQSPRNAKHEYLLTGLIKCGCGYAMNGATKQTWSYYRCGAHGAKATGLEDICHQTIDLKRVEQAAWIFVVDVLTQRGRFTQWLHDAQALELAALQPRRDDLKNIEALIAIAEKEATEVANALRRTTGVVARKLEAQSDEIDQRYAKLSQSRDRIKAELEEAVFTDASIADLNNFAAVVVDGLNDPTFVQKRRWLGYLQVKVVVFNKVATISCRLPVRPAIIDLRSSKITSCQNASRI